MKNYRFTLVMVLATLLTLALAGAVPLAAQHDDESFGEGEQTHGAETHWHKNHLSLFLGITDEEAESEFTIGVDYERRLSRWFGLGVLVETIRGDARELIVGIPIFLHATEKLRFVLAAGYESLGPFEDDKGHHKERETVIRLGAEYAFHRGNYSISPSFSVDFVHREEILVYGIAIGRGW